MKWNRSSKISLITLLSLGLIGVTYSLFDRLGFIFPLALWSEVLCDQCPQHIPYHKLPPEVRLIAPVKPINELLGDRFDKTKISILIEKSRHRLTIYQNKIAIKSYPVVFGDNPKGDKFIEGDRRTPEGIFHLKDLYPHPQWSKFLWLDYPNAASWRKHLTAKQTGKIPWYTSIGKDVGIHGVPTNSDKLIDAQVNWTWGCISLKTADVNEIYLVSRSGTLVEIIP
jgi:L,D-transpeptidase catalytic domain